jgi:hypothetical protein
VFKEDLFMKSNASSQATTIHLDSKAQIITDKAVRTMADAIFKHLQDEGCQPKDIINVSSQLLGLVTTEITRAD